MDPKARSTGRGYFDRRFNAQIINVSLGGQELASAEGDILSTVLGSCVAACLRDPIARVGGMNHFLLPGEPAAPADGGARDMRFGVTAMELLINALLKAGALRSRLEAKVFGGAAVLGRKGADSVGGRNAAFALRFLACECIPVAAHDLGGDAARRAYYEPATGRAWVNRIAAPRASGIVEAETAYRQSLRSRRLAMNLEIF